MGSEMCIRDSHNVVLLVGVLAGQFDAILILELFQVLLRERSLEEDHDMRPLKRQKGQRSDRIPRFQVADSELQLIVPVFATLFHSS